MLRSVLLGCSDTKMCAGRPWWQNLSSCLKEVGQMCSLRVFQAEQQVQRCWSTHVLGVSEEVHGGQCGWRTVDRGEWLGAPSWGRGVLHIAMPWRPWQKDFCCHHSPSFPVLPPVTARSSLLFRILSNYSRSSFESSEMYETENQQQSKSRLN